MRLITAVVLALAPWVLQVQQPPRDTRQPAPQVGTGEIRGRVVAADGGGPLRKVRVNLMSMGPRPTPPPPGRGGSVQMPASGPANNRSVETDDSGGFVFTGLAAGRYRLAAAPGPARPQYLSLQYGAKQPTDPGRPLDLADGERLEGLALSLPRAAVITGRVTDEAGEPLARVMVYTLQSRGGQVTRTGPSWSTDDLGQFRLFGIAPGDYLVAAESRQGMGGPPAEGETIGYVTTYSPGTTNPSEALRLRLAPGQEVTADVRMIPGRLFQITGSVMNARGEPVRRANVQVMRRDQFGGMSGSGASVMPDGRFTANGLAPGEYRLVARAMPDPPPGGGMMMSVPAGPTEMAIETVFIGQADVTDVVLMLAPGATVTGTVLFDPPPGNPVRVRVSTAAADRFNMMGESSAEATDDSFTLANLFGPILIRASAMAPGWTLKSVSLRGRDITDVPTTFSSQDSGRLQVLLTSRAPSLEGTVAGDDGQPVKDGGVVVIFGEDPATWIARSSMQRTATISPDGTFRAQGLREGAYFLVAMPRDRAPNLSQPSAEMFEALSKDATRVTLGEDERRTVDLRLATGARR